jgi:hypothetical protein
MNANQSHRFPFDIRALATVACGLLVAAFCLTFPTPRVSANLPNDTSGRSPALRPLPTAGIGFNATDPMLPRRLVSARTVVWKY